MASIYAASKVIHAPMWRALRTMGVPIISTWIDEAGSGQSADLGDLWCRCIDEPARATALVVYVAPGETMKGALVEVGAALGRGTRVYAVGVPEAHTWLHHPGVTVCASVDEALAKIMTPAWMTRHVVSWEAKVSA